MQSFNLTPRTGELRSAPSEIATRYSPQVLVSGAPSLSILPLVLAAQRDAVGLSRQRLGSHAVENPAGSAHAPLYSPHPNPRSQRALEEPRSTTVCARFDEPR